MSYEMRPFRTIDELHACVALQKETWGNGFSEQVPTAILKVAQILGGIAAGAYDADGVLAGFVFGMTGVRNGELVHWSDMLAVRQGGRDRGLGFLLKRYQRDEMLARGVTKMFWTFDPLQSRNAHLNFSKLGIVVGEYARDMYGQTDSPLHRGIGTDRFVALWAMDSKRVEDRLSGAEATGAMEAVAKGATVVLGSPESEGGLPVPGTPRVDVAEGPVLVAIPADLGAVMESSPPLALRWREATRAALTHYLDRGWEVRELLRGEPTSSYLLIREDRR